MGSATRRQAVIYFGGGHAREDKLLCAPQPLGHWRIVLSFVFLGATGPCLVATKAGGTMRDLMDKDAGDATDDTFRPRARCGCLFGRVLCEELMEAVAPFAVRRKAGTFQLS